jgi:hypothetical protein
MFLQTLVYDYHGNKMLLAMGTYNSNSGVGIRCVSLDIIQSRGRGKGILTTELRYRRDSLQKTFVLLKGQIEGIVDARYVYIRDIVSFLNQTNVVPSMNSFDIYTYNDLPYISISASSCLVDPDIPLRYSLQNAFDGDPATSYVENTEDDLIKLEFSGIYRYGYINKIAIINGYAQNNQLYLQNNRIKTIKQIKNIENTILRDNYLLYQFVDMPNKPQFVIVEDIYKGLKYNDTCIAELNVKTDFGWLFGDIDE